MKIDKVILSCDDTESYLKLWPYVSKVCKLTLGITPVLFHITDEYSGFKSDDYGIVKKIKKNPDLSANFQSQVFRLYGAKFFPDEVCLISDIDMLIFNREYFIKDIENFNREEFVVFLSDAYDLSRPETQNMWALNRVPMCYVCGTGKNFINLLDIDCDFNEFSERIYNFDYGYVVPPFHMDEVYLGKKIFRNLKNIKITNLKRNIEDIYNIPGRIEKNNFWNIQTGDIQRKKYIDAHVPKDWVQNENKFLEIINEILIHN